MELEKKAGGLSAVVEKIFEVENPDALFAVFAFKKENQSLIVARSQKEIIDLNELLEVFGGGGHTMAASALLKGIASPRVFAALEKYLNLTLTPAIIADQIMSPAPHVIHDGWSLLEASKFLEKINHTGAPVTNTDGELVGFMTLRDIMKGRKAEQMHSPVKAYMTRKAITGQTRTTVREIADLFFDNNIGHLPIVDGNKVIGIVTRSDYLDCVEKRRQENRHVDLACRPSTILISCFTYIYNLFFSTSPLARILQTYR
jgi:tRNA nucleotidyltransferase (CCA-adding enzyme)